MIREFEKKEVLKCAKCGKVLRKHYFIYDKKIYLCQLCCTEFIKGLNEEGNNV